MPGRVLLVPMQAGGVILLAVTTAVGRSENPPSHLERTRAAMTDGLDQAQAAGASEGVRRWRL